MKSISYNSGEIIRLFSNWDTIMSMWDDKKSHSINDSFFLPIQSHCDRLIEIGEAVHNMVKQIENDSDSIY